MERLTSNKPVDEMSIVELAHNCCYAKDRRARYRDFSIDVDARELTRLLLKKYAEGDDAFTCDEDFDEEMIDYLQYGTETLEGLIALFYQNLWAMADLRERLKAYEDAEEQGLLLRLPVAIGSDVYYIPSKAHYGLNVLHNREEFNRVYHQKISRLHFTESGWYAEGNLNLEYGVVDRLFVDKLYKETWFLSQEEAEQALKQMGE